MVDWPDVPASQGSAHCHSDQEQLSQFGYQPLWIMTSTETNLTVEQKSEVTAVVATDPGGEKHGRFDEKESCSFCKIQREENEEIKRENKQLREELREMTSRVRRKVCLQVLNSINYKQTTPAKLQREENEEIKRENKQLKEELREMANKERRKVCPQATNSIDGLPEEGSCGQNKGTTVAMKGSPEMNKKNDSSQMKGLLSPESPVCREGVLVNLEDERSIEPSTSGGASDCRQVGTDHKRAGTDHKQAGTDPKRATGGCNDELGKSCPLSELKSVPGSHMELDDLLFSSSHTVLVDVNLFNIDKSLIAQEGCHVWDKISVKMPYADERMLNKPRWETIKKYLHQLATASRVTTEDVENTIKKYNPKYKDQWSFEALHRFFKEKPSCERKTHSHTLSRMAELAIRLPSTCKKNIPLLQHGRNHSITLSQMQIACLLANAFYCTFPHRNATHPQAEYANYPTINFHSLFGKWSDRKRQKLQAIFHYFKEVTGEESKVPRGLVTFSRRHIPDSNLLDWTRRQETLTKLHISSEGTIEKNGQGMLQVDFACSLVGGGVLASGLGQEEILFLMNPELIVARLFTEKLGATECLKIMGSQQYSEYSDSFAWAGPHEDKTERDEWKRRHRQIVAIDALHFKYPKEQFNMQKVDRELNKAYCGFMGEKNTPPDYYPAVATGNWGCGAFGGDPRLKALIQMMAASVAKRDVAYFTVEDSHLELDLRRIHHFLTRRKVTVGRLYKTLEDFCSALYTNHRETSNLYDFIMRSLTETTSRH
ncbi:hypothetical protein SKAU_G00362840 [Synaphobranchus kaupii]|uniref:poly(ADP-ribose) glycohydrolase n=1 Tax=Synaphobranchus kaupii TaxID=118154 RepID=A0A9Q1EIQ8_SYNKA|nr:hypothetical protein SKAU_G00362840 [Synaphobranchus kaupii]